MNGPGGSGRLQTSNGTTNSLQEARSYVWTASEKWVVSCRESTLWKTAL
jgi:hypothetical protein